MFLLWSESLAAVARVRRGRGWSHEGRIRAGAGAESPGPARADEGKASFFDSLDRKKLKEMLEVRVAEGSLMRLIGKCLHVGVLDGLELSRSESGTAHGSVLSPLLGDVYLY